ncbi:hypothetical protein Tco_0138088 [Tanacetum coccineum]
MDDNLKEHMTYEADDNTRYDPSDIRGDDEIELTDEESFDDEDEVAETYLQRILRDLRPIKITRMIRSMNGTKMYHGLTRNHRPKLNGREDGYCNGGNFLGAYVIGNSLHYQDLEWYEALEDSELKEEALRNKAIMEGLIEGDDGTYSFRQNEEYVAIKENEYDDLMNTCNDACQAYQEIFRMMDEGWMVTRAK